MGIHNTQMYERTSKAVAKQSVALDVLSYHASAPMEDVNRLKVSSHQFILNTTNNLMYLYTHLTPAASNRGN